VSAPSLDDADGAEMAAAAPPLRVALGEYDTGWHDPAASLARAADVVAGAVRLHARLVVLPEMCTTGFTMEPEQWAEPLDGRSVGALSALARRQRVWILAGLALREAPDRAVNAAVLFDAGGAVAAVYRKQRLFAHGGEHEHYVPGDAPVVTTIEGVRVAPFICYDLRFPELFRAVATEVDAIVVVANWPAQRRAHWDALTRARAIENQCYVIAVNRTGAGGDTAYDGGSAAYDPWGEAIGIGGGGGAGGSMGGSIGAPRVADVEPTRVQRVRERYPFLRDIEALREAPLRA
jgi:predicted amidohydrolase